MNVLIIANGFPSKSNPGLGVFEYDQAKALKKMGIKVTFLFVDLRSFRRKRKFGYTTFTIEGIEVHGVSFPCGRIAKKLLYAIGGWQIKKGIKHIKKKVENIDIVHTHFFDIGCMYYHANIEDYRWIHTEHSSNVNKKIFDKYILEIGKKMYDSCKIISVSTSVAENILENFNVNSTVIPNIIDLDCFKYISRNTNNEFTFVSTGNLVEIKRMDYLIKNFSETFNDDEKVKLIIIGDGSLYVTLNNLIKKLGQEDKIRLLGKKSREEINKIYSLCNCFILLSASETFGVAYVEAMATGLPVIATKCGGPEDFVNKNNGILVEKYDDLQLRECIKNIVYNFKFDSLDIANQTHDGFSSDNIANKILSVYKEVKIDGQ